MKIQIVAVSLLTFGEITIFCYIILTLVSIKYFSKIKNSFKAVFNKNIKIFLFYPTSPPSSVSLAFTIMAC
jgi:hypothetical protein